MKISLAWLGDYLSGGSALDAQTAADALTNGGLPVEMIERHGDDGHSDRVVILAAELVRMKLDVIVTFGAVAGVAIKKAHGVLLFQRFTDFNVRPGLIALIA